MWLAIFIFTVLVANSVLIMISREFDHVADFLVFFDKRLNMLIVRQLV